MKLLVTGAKGQVGSALCRMGRETPFEVIGLDSHALDIADRGSINQALEKYNPDFLINAAAYTAVDKAESEPQKAEMINGTAVGYLAELTDRRGIPFIHVSTDYVFDGEKAGAYIEEDVASPLGVYGRTKLLGEELVVQFQRKAIILRTSWVFGIEGNNFPKTMLRLARERSELGVVADQIGCPTFADDIANTIFGIIAGYQDSPNNFSWGLYHYAGSDHCSWFDFARYILESAHRQEVISTMPILKKLTTDQYPTMARRPQNSVLCCNKFCKAFPGLSLSDWRKGVKCLI